jgi:hypothetical protein
VGQQIDSITVLKADSLVGLSNKFYTEGDFENSANTRKEAILFYKNIGDWKNVVAQYNSLYTITIEDEDLQSAELALDSAFFYIGKLEDRPTEYFYTLGNLGYEEWLRTNYSQAINYLSEAVFGLDSIGTPFYYYANSLHTLLASCRQKGENVKAIDLCELYIDKLSQEENVDASNVAKLIFEKGLSQRDNASYDEAIITMKQALGKNKEIENVNSRLTNKYRYNRSLARIYRMTGQLDSALYYINYSNSIRIDQKKQINYLSHFYKANILYDLHRKSEAITELESSISKYESRKIKKNKTRSTLYSLMGRIYTDLDIKDSSQHYLAIASDFLAIPIDKKFDSYNDYIESRSFNLNNVKTLSCIADGEMLNYKLTQNKEYRENAIMRYEQAFNGTKYLYKELSSNSAKYQLNNNLQSYIGQYLSLLLEIYNENNDDALLDKIFQLIEDNKSIVLKEDIYKRKILEQSQLPTSVLENDISYRKQINDLNRKIYNHKSKSESAEKLLADWKNELIQSKIDYERFQREMEKTYPEFYKSNYEISNIDLEAIQKELKSDECYLNYFNVNKKLVCIWISNTEKGLLIIDDKEYVKNDIVDFITQVRTKPIEDIDLISFHKFKSLGYSIFEKLIPTEARKYSEIIVSPYDFLYYLPFEILLTDSSNRANSFKSLSYLLDQSAISYAFSSDLFIQSRVKSNYDKSIEVVSYAPFNSETLVSEERNIDGEILANLGCSGDELGYISSYYKNNSFINSEATAEVFLSNTDFDIIHLATHASVEDQDENFNKLYFANDYVALQDVSEMELSTSLVVLSACNTGMGNIRSGEGMINLGRGFRSAGVSSIITSLWSLNDCTTSLIIDKFYSNLTDMGISQSLRLAKMTYLAEANKQKAHPYYWSGLIFSGNSKVFQSSKMNLSNSLTIGYVIMGVILIVFMYKKTKSIS